MRFDEEDCNAPLTYTSMNKNAKLDLTLLYDILEMQNRVHNDVSIYNNAGHDFILVF